MQKRSKLLHCCKFANVNFFLLSLFFGQNVLQCLQGFYQSVRKRKNRNSNTFTHTNLQFWNFFACLLACLFSVKCFNLNESWVRAWIFVYNQSNEHRSTNNKPRFGRPPYYDDVQVKRSSHIHTTHKQNNTTKSSMMTTKR